MKKILLLFVVVLTGTASQAQEIKWMTFNEAVAAQKKDPRPIFMDAYTDWCGPCKMLDKNTFTDPQIIEHINKNYYAVKFNAEGNEEITYKEKEFSNPGFNANRKGRNATHEFTMFLRIPGYPSMVVFNEQSEVSNVIVGYNTPAQLLERLK